MQYNTAPAVPGRGSGIFLHVGTGQATHGCISLPRQELLRLLRRLRPGASISIRYCIICSHLYSTRLWQRAAILGCAGYAGQETLDRVLGHPGLDGRGPRLRLARRPAARARSTRA